MEWIMVGRDSKNKIVNIRKIKNKILSTKLALEKEMMHIISMYAPQIGLIKKTRDILWIPWMS